MDPGSDDLLLKYVLIEPGVDIIRRGICLVYPGCQRIASSQGVVKKEPFVTSAAPRMRLSSY